MGPLQIADFKHGVFCGNGSSQESLRPAAFELRRSGKRRVAGNCAVETTESPETAKSDHSSTSSTPCASLGRVEQILPGPAAPWVGPLHPGSKQFVSRNDSDLYWLQRPLQTRSLAGGEYRKILQPLVKSVDSRESPEIGSRLKPGGSAAHRNREQNVSVHREPHDASYATLQYQLLFARQKHPTPPADG